MELDKILNKFFELMLEEFWETIDWVITAEKLNPIIQRWINDWVIYNEKEVKERIEKELIKKFRSKKYIIEHDFCRLWLSYSPKVLLKKDLQSED